MGQDLLIVSAPMPLGSPNKVDSLGWMKIYRELVDTVSDMDILAIYEDRYGDLPDIEDLDEDIPRGQADFLLARQARAEIKNLIKTIFTDNWIDAEYLYFNGGFVLLTGGMSWGDSPSESFDDIAVMNTIFHCAEKTGLGFYEGA